MDCFSLSMCVGCELSEQLLIVLRLWFKHGPVYCQHMKGKLSVPSTLPNNSSLPKLLSILRCIPLCLLSYNITHILVVTYGSCTLPLKIRQCMWLLVPTCLIIWHGAWGTKRGIVERPLFKVVIFMFNAFLVFPYK